MRGRNYCSGVNVDGSDCGRALPTLPSGVRIRTRCHIHARQTWEERQARRHDREARAAERQQERGVL